MAPPAGDDAPFARTRVRLFLGDIDVELHSETGLFSQKRIDVGTVALLKHAPWPPQEGDLLDLGCGYGPIAVALAIRSPRARVWAIDTDDRALELAETNVGRLGLSNVVVCTPRAVPADVTFRAVYSNPPTRIGKVALRSLLSRWLDRLAPKGVAYFVIQKEAGADRVAQSLAEAGYPTTRIASKRGYRLLSVRRGRRDDRRIMV